MTEQILREIPAVAKVRDPELREAVVRTWAAALRRGGYHSLSEIPQSARVRNRSLLDHVNEVNDLVVILMEMARNTFGLAFDHDTLMAAAVLHDVDKAFIQRVNASGKMEYVDSYSMPDHGPTGADLALTCGVPEAVCELVRYHAPFSYEGHLPATPEGTILHYADLAAFDLAALAAGSTPIHAMSVILKRTHPLLPQTTTIPAH